MKEFQYVIKDKDGIHARPAGDLVKLAKTYTSNITIHKDEKSGDCKKIFTVMALAAKCGDEITLKFEGEDEEAACEAFKSFLNENL